MKQISALLLILSIYGSAQQLQLETFATGFSSPVAMANAGDQRMFVVERPGNIKIIQESGEVLSPNFLSIGNRVISGGERGLLGLAFHPEYTQNGYFYVNYTRQPDGATIIARYQVSATNPNLADAASETILLTIPQPYSNHNGGTLKFGPDGYLYIGMGDGGSGGDPQNLAQNLTSLLGKMLRIDVDSGSPYSIPADNPYVNSSERDEIFFSGLRNPWKFSFNRENGTLWIADVGQNAYEEINKITAPHTPGLNFGWRCYEANEPYSLTGCESQDHYTFPVAHYSLGGGFCSIIGGYEYTGATYPGLQNKYFFADFCANRIGYIAHDGGTITWSTPFGGSITGFGEDHQGELYVIAMNTGVISKLKDGNLSIQEVATRQIQVSPNPVKDAAQITGIHQAEISHIMLYNAAGQVTKAQTQWSGNTLILSLNHLPTGIYVLNAHLHDGSIISQRIIKR
ncbi:MAG: PQQ-dependent sugar dehydrogenase [Weeksellaceae bacterium]|nr:PQQ-dependent sugar dehydrogenase [Weeksellaceae bacterium]